MGEFELFWALFIIEIIFFDGKLNELNELNCPFKGEFCLSKTLPLICT